MSSATATNMPPQLNGANRLNGQAVDLAIGGNTTTAGTSTAPIFSPLDIELLTYRRFNPLAALTASSLSYALDAFTAGDLRPFAILCEEILRRDETLASVKAKREEAVALRDVSYQQLDESTDAEDQAAALRWFYENLRATEALRPMVSGGLPMLITQMMDNVPYGTAAHHLIWQPNAARTFKLPSGRVVPSLAATFEQVPLEFFEARTGVLRFLGPLQGYVGQPLTPGDWLITTGPCLMRAASILHYYKRLATQDLINFSEKFGTPGIVVHTTAQQGTPEAAAAETAARSMAGNYRGVLYGAVENKVEFLWPSGGSGGAQNLPMHTIRDDVKRELAILWLGADLSTMSRGGSQRGVGASLQASEQERREQADCVRISETLQAQIDPLVIRWFFGPDAPILARTTLESPINEDRSLLSNLVQQLVSLGAKVPIRPVAKRLSVPIAENDEEVFTAPAAPVNPTPDNVAAAVNVAPLPAHLQQRADTARAALGTVGRLALARAAAKDRAPVRERLDALLALNAASDTDPTIFRAGLLKLQRDWPALLAQVNADPAAGRVLSDTLSAGFFNGIIEGSVSHHQAPPGTLASNDNPYHLGPGEHGGQFTSADGAGGGGGSADPHDTAAQIARGRGAMEAAIAGHDMWSAMETPDLGTVAFISPRAGQPGKGFHDGGGVSHLIAARNAEKKDGAAIARRMPEVIALGQRGNLYGPPGGQRINIVHQGYTAVLSLHHFGSRQTWLLTGLDYEKP
ncbi:MAG: DUF935 family protein [Verrucomicrobia bacterium]|nr:DUF935 family protein [Verrucomicrobiota bacterium]